MRTGRELGVTDVVKAKLVRERERKRWDGGLDARPAARTLASGKMPAARHGRRAAKGAESVTRTLRLTTPFVPFRSGMDGAIWVTRPVPHTCRGMAPETSVSSSLTAPERV